MTFEKEEQQELITTASSWCASNGLLMSPSPSSPNTFEPAPISLYPTPFPQQAFATVQTLSFNRLVHNVASDYEFLKQTLQQTADSDPEFTGKLLQLADRIHQEEGRRIQTITLGILRSDYMLHGDDLKTAKPLQVELNTIASSFGCLSAKVTKLHRHLEFLGRNSDGKSLPDNPAAENIVEGMAVALREYKRQREEQRESRGGGEEEEKELVVVMVVQPGETNSVDQRDLEFLLQSQHQIRTIRRTLQELSVEGHYNDDGYFQNKELLIPSKDKRQMVAAVVYYRAGYTPNDYPTQQEWDGRWKVELSAAIKCPDVFYHLVGTKKMQQTLAEPSILSRFTSTPDQAIKLSSTFANLYPLGEDPHQDELTLKLICQHPHKYILKPQREGGGNNIYHPHILPLLKSLEFEQRSRYIVMQKIVPPTVSGTLLKQGCDVVYEGDQVVCELGVFGVILAQYGDGGGSHKKVIWDTVGGHILRSKSVDVEEGGVAAGYAFLSSPRLV